MMQLVAPPDEEPPMSVALAEPRDGITATDTNM
jgi:hypothetical protein